MAYIGRQQSPGSFLKLDDISSQFNNVTSDDSTVHGELTGYASRSTMTLFEISG